MEDAEMTKLLRCEYQHYKLKTAGVHVETGMKT